MAERTAQQRVGSKAVMWVSSMAEPKASVTAGLMVVRKVGRMADHLADSWVASTAEKRAGEKAA